MIDFYRLGKKIECLLKGHLWVEWAHDESMPRWMFKGNSVILKEPYCNRCMIPKK